MLVFALGMGGAGNGHQSTLLARVLLFRHTTRLNVG
jgi:hypothetical protein